MTNISPINDAQVWDEWVKGSLVIRWHGNPENDGAITVIVSYRSVDLDEIILSVGETSDFEFNESISLRGVLSLYQTDEDVIVFSILATEYTYTENKKELYTWNILTGSHNDGEDLLDDNWSVKWRIFGQQGAVMNALVTLMQGNEIYNSELLSPKESLVWKTNCNQPRSFLECGASIAINYQNEATLTAFTPGSKVVEVNDTICVWEGDQPIPPNNDPGKVVSVGNGRPSHYFSSFTYPIGLENPTKEQLFQRFFSIFNQGEFQTTLVDEKSSGSSGREQMIANAQKFIQGASPYEGQYIADLSSLPKPFNTLVEPDVSLFLHVDYSDKASIESAFVELTGVTTKSFVEDKEYEPILSRLQDSITACLISIERNSNTNSQLMRSIIVCNLAYVLVNHKDTKWCVNSLHNLTSANALLSEKIFPLPRPESSKKAGSGSKSIMSSPGAYHILGVSDVMVLRQSLDSYCPGELAHVETVMKSEFREIVVEKGDYQQTSTTDSNNDSFETTSVNELSGGNRIQPLEAVERVFNNLSQSYNQDGLSKTISGGWFDSPGTLSSDNSTFTPGTSASAYARQILDQSISLTDKKIRKERSTLHNYLLAERDTRSFDNRQGDDHITGYYRWINERYTVFLDRQESRLIMEFYLPDPSKKFIDQQQLFNGTNRDLAPPPWEDIMQGGIPIKGISSAADISRANYASINQRYQSSELNPPPAETLTYSIAFQGEPPLDSGAIKVDDGYVVTSFSANYIAKNGESNEAYVLVGSHYLSITANEAAVTQDISQTPLSGEVCLAAVCEAEQYSIIINIVASCQNDSKEFVAWQNMTYEAIYLAYENNRASYIEEFNASLNRFKTSSKSTSVYQPILRRQCISMLIDTFKNQWNIENNTSINEDDINFTLIPFFDRCINWGDMIVTFNPKDYDSDHHKDDSWLTMNQVKGNDNTDEFILSGSANIMVSVRYDYVLPMLYYIFSEGRFWFGKSQLSPVYEKAINLANTWKKERVCESGTIDSWIMELSTTMMTLNDSHQAIPFSDGSKFCDKHVISDLSECKK